MNNTFLRSVALTAVVLTSCSRTGLQGTKLGDGGSWQQASDDYFTANDERVSDARYYYLRGQLALSSDNLPEAETYLTQAAAIEKTAAPALRNSLAFLYVRQGKIDEALRVVEHGLKVDPHNPELLQTKAAVFASTKRYDEAIAVLKEIKNPDDSRTEDYYNFLSGLYIQKGDVQGAQQTLNELSEKKPNSFVAHYQLGRLYEASGNVARAELEYTKAAELNSDNRTIVVDLVRTLLSQKKFAEAEKLLNRELAKDPTDPTLHNAKVQLYLVQKNLDKAIEELKLLSKSEDDPTQTEIKIALILLEQRKYDASVAKLRELLVKKPDQLGINYYLGTSLAAQKKYPQAVEALQKIDTSSQFFVESRLMAASMSQQQKKTKEALAFIEDALKSKPENVQLLSLKAQLTHDLGDKEGALAVMEHLSRIEPNEEKHAFLKAVYLDELGRRSEAEATLRALVQRSPNNSNALNYLGYTLVEQEKGDLVEAEQLIKRAIQIEPNNGYYIDSLGWLYFKQNRFAEADKFLAEAVKQVGDDAVILEHYVRALIKVGKTSEAKKYLAKAEKRAPYSDDKAVGARLIELRQGLDAKK